MSHLNERSRLVTFGIVWFGQVVSLLGSGLTSFALSLWVYQQTGSVMQYALVALSSMIPRILVSPLAGVLVDRYDRRWMMIVSDSACAFSTLATAALLISGQLELWHIYVLTAVRGAFGALQWPAYSAAITLLVPQHHLGRASGWVQVGGALGDILAPTLAGILLLQIQLSGVILVDVGTFGFALITLLAVRFPRAQSTDRGLESGRPQWRDLLFGWRYITGRAGLLALLFFTAVVNFLWGMVGALLPPMVLAFASADQLGLIVSVAGCGMLAGSVLMGLWGGPARRIRGVLGFELISGLCFMLIGLRPEAGLVAVGALIAHFTIAVVSGCDQALWQSRVPTEFQGRVFAFRQMIALSSTPLAFILAGPLADRIFSPLLMEGGNLASSLSPLLGTGAGRGIGLMFLVMGVIKVAASAAGGLYPRLRDLEDELPEVYSGSVRLPAG